MEQKRIKNEDINKAIKGISCFSEFNPIEIEFLANHCSRLIFKPGNYLLNSDQKADCFYFILEGTVSIQVLSEKEGIIELESIQNSGFLGCGWLNSPYKNDYSAMAFKQTDALVFDAITIKKEMEKNHEFGYKMYELFTKIITDRFKSFRKNIVELYEKNF